MDQIEFRKPGGGPTMFREHADGKLEVLDPQLKENWDAQIRIEEAVAREQEFNMTESANTSFMLPCTTKLEAYRSHIKLHNWAESTAPDGWTPALIQKEHDRVAKIILARGWKHNDLADTLDLAAESDIKKRTTEMANDDADKIKESHSKIHQLYPNATDQRRAEEMHKYTVELMLEFGIDHAMGDDLDKTLPDELKG